MAKPKRSNMITAYGTDEHRQMVQQLSKASGMSISKMIIKYIEDTHAEVFPKAEEGQS